MAGETFVSTLAAINRQVYADLMFQQIGLRPILSRFSERHDVTGGTTLNFQSIAPLAATDVHEGDDEDLPTVYTALSAANSTMTISELYVAVYLSQFETEVGPIRDPNSLAAGMVSALLDRLEDKLVDAAVAGAADEVGADLSALSLATMISAKAKFNPYPQFAQAWILNASGETALLSDADFQNASSLGTANPMVTGELPRILGLPATQSSFLAANRSVLIGQGTMHYGVAGDGPRVDVVLDPDARAWKIVARLAAGVKYLATNQSKAVRIKHT